jgi:hypothetical protein
MLKHNRYPGCVRQEGKWDGTELRRNEWGECSRNVWKRRSAVVASIFGDAPTPEQRRELHEKADRILETEFGGLLAALVDILYERAMKGRNGC